MAVIGILSGKGGVGKTTVTTNLAAALADDYGRNVVILDTNLYSSHIKLHFGLFGDETKTLPEILRNKKFDKFVYARGSSTLDIIPSSSTIKDVDFDRLKSFVSNLADSKYDFVIIDCAPGFGKDVQAAIKASEELLVVTTPQIPDVDDALKIMELVKMMRKKVTGVIVNRVQGKKYELKMEQLEKTFDAPIVAVIPEEKKVPESIAAGVPLMAYAKFSAASTAMKKLAAKLAGEKYKPAGPLARFKEFLVGERFDISQKPEEFLEKSAE